MRSTLALAAFAATAAAQAQNLTAALTGNANLTALTGIVTQFPELVAALSSATNITILAPSNTAFEAFLNSSGANSTLGNSELVQAILSYHVLNGTINSTQITSDPVFAATQLQSPLLANVTGGQRVEALNSSGTVSIISGLLQTSNVTEADIAYDNGIIHIIDSVLTPPLNISTTAIQLGLSAIAGALTSADLVETVDTARDITVFVPNNEAFDAIASIFANATTETLTSVLGYHVIAGQVLYSDLVGNGSVASLQGANLTTTVANGSVFVNQARVVIPNVLVANGVVHVIDSVLNPNTTNVAPGTNGTAFEGASSSEGTPFTSGVPTPSSSVSVPSQATANPTSASSSGLAVGGVQAMATGAVGYGVLFAGALLAL